MPGFGITPITAIRSLRIPRSGEPSVPDPAIGEGSLELVQVLVPDSVEPCDAVAQSGGLVATWLEAKVEQ